MVGIGSFGVAKEKRHLVGLPALFPDICFSQTSLLFEVDACCAWFNDDFERSMGM